MPCTRLRSANSKLNILTQSRSCSTCVHAQFVDYAQTVVTSIFEGGVLDLLYVQLRFEQLFIFAYCVNIVCHNGQLCQWLANANLLSLTQAECAGYYFAYLIHGAYEVVVSLERIAQFC